VRFRNFMLGWVWRLSACVTTVFFVVSVAFVGHAWKPGPDSFGSRSLNITGAALCFVAGSFSAVTLSKHGRALKPRHGIVSGAISLLGQFGIGVVAIVFFPVTLGLWSARRRARNGTQLSQLERLAAVQQLLR
jgi:hypothetical protein